jgi:hypothetical protein
MKVRTRVERTGRAAAKHGSEMCSLVLCSGSPIKAVPVLSRCGTCDDAMSVGSVGRWQLSGELSAQPGETGAKIFFGS